jgi:hypothetical protein
VTGDGNKRIEPRRRGGDTSQARRVLTRLPKPCGGQEDAAKRFGGPRPIFFFVFSAPLRLRGFVLSGPQDGWLAAYCLSTFWISGSAATATASGVRP